MRISDWSSDVCSPDLVITRQLTLTNATPKHDDLFELGIHRTVDAQIGKVARQPSNHFLVKNVGRNDENQNTTILQLRQCLLIEELFQPGAASTFVSHVAIGVSGEITVRDRKSTRLNSSH